MRAAIFSFTFHGENSMVASTRIANFISKKMDLRVHDHRTVEEILGKPLDLLIIINGAYGFCKCLPELAQLVLTARRIVWVQNDYSIIPPKTDSKGVSPFRAAFRERHEKGLPHMDFWTTCEDWARFTPDSLYVNWNALTFDEYYDEDVIARRRNSKSNNNLLYYGSFRDGSGKSSRLRYFDRYFADPKVHTIISSPAKQFRGRYINIAIQHEDAIKSDFYGVLGGCGLGLYLEDRMSHERFHSPANRFYEMLSAGLPMVFQPEAESMMARAGFKIFPWIATNARSIQSYMDAREKIGLDQRRLWIGEDPSKFRRVLTEQFDSALQAQMDRLA
jgi:hypothetical protein